MIEIVEGLPDNIVGLVAKGRVSRKDVCDVLVPAIEKARRRHHRLRLYYEIRTRYPGAGWEEVGLATDQAAAWERVAIVADAAWIRHAVTALRLVIPSAARVFTTSQIPDGIAWITGAVLRPRRAKPAHRPVGTEPFRPLPQYLHHPDPVG